MMQSVRRLACVALFYIFSHPAPALSQSQKSQIWRIPVLPPVEAGNSEEAPPSELVAPSRARAKFFQRLLRSSEEVQISAQELSIDEAVLARSRTISDALSHLGLLSLGGESGAWAGGRVSMRGFPGREPEALLEGVSLGTGFTGASASEMVPTLAVSTVQAYPFLPALGQPRRGIAGAYDLSLKAGRQNARKESLVRVEQPQALVLTHREELGCSASSSTSPLGCVQFVWQSAVRNGAQNVRDDNNTPLNSSDDFETRLRHNELARTSVSVRMQKISDSGLLFDTVSLLGAEDRGINGLPVLKASPDNRSRKMFALFSHRSSFLSLETGRLWRGRIDGRIDSVGFSTRQNTRDRRLRIDERDEKVVGLGLGVSQPAHLSTGDVRFFFNSNFEQNHYRSRFGLGAGAAPTDPVSTSSLIEDSSLEGRLTAADVGAGTEFRHPAHLLLRIELFAQLMSTRQNHSCGAFSPQVLCATQSSAVAQTSPGAALELQWAVARQVVLYAVLGRSTRLPTPLELAGRPDGVAANLELNPESSIFYESGVQTPFVHGGAFFARDTNLIALRQVNPYLVKHFNTSRVHRGGVFLRAEVRFSRLELEAAHEQVWAKAFVHGAFNQHVPFVPERHSRGTARLQLGNANVSAGHGSVALHLTQTGAYALEPESIYRLSPPAMMALEAVGQVPRARETLEFGFKIDNLLDTRVSRLAIAGGETRDVAWSYLPALPIMGRSIVFSLKLLTS